MSQDVKSAPLTCRCVPLQALPHACAELCCFACSRQPCSTPVLSYAAVGHTCSAPLLACGGIILHLLTWCSSGVQSWVGTMAAHLKAADPNHLVGIGEEGFYGASAAGNRSSGVNPSGT